MSRSPIQARGKKSGIFIPDSPNNETGQETASLIRENTTLVLRRPSDRVATLALLIPLKASLRHGSQLETSLHPSREKNGKIPAATRVVPPSTVAASAFCRFRHCCFSTSAPHLSHIISRSPTSLSSHLHNSSGRSSDESPSDNCLVRKTTPVEFHSLRRARVVDLVGTRTREHPVKMFRS